MADPRHHAAGTIPAAFFYRQHNRLIIVIISILPFYVYGYNLINKLIVDSVTHLDYDVYCKSRGCDIPACRPVPSAAGHLVGKA
jgi:hypothetical protein